MPGSSLWLIVPQPEHPFNKSLNDLMHDTIKSDFSTYKLEKFTPHVTLTSDIEPSTYSSGSAQEWLDGLDLDLDFKKELNEVHIELELLEAGNSYFKKLYLRAGKDENLVKLAAKAREQTGKGISEDEARKWAENEYLPHLSLMYSDVGEDVVQKKLGLVELQLGWEFGSLFACCGGQLAGGAKIVLVDTSGEVAGWKVLAERQAPWVAWKIARGLI